MHADKKSAVVKSSGEPVHTQGIVGRIASNAVCKWKPGPHHPPLCATIYRARLSPRLRAKFPSYGPAVGYVGGFNVLERAQPRSLVCE